MGPDRLRRSADPARPLRRQRRPSTNATTTTSAIAATLMRSRIVGQAASLSSEQNGHLASARLLERTCWARVTPRRKCPEPQYSGTNHRIGISTNSPMTSLRAPGSFQNSHSP